MGTSQNGKVEGITNKIFSKRLDASLAEKWRKPAKNARDGRFLAILTGEPPILALLQAPSGEDEQENWAAL